MGSIGKRMKQLRKKINKTQEEVAKALGIQRITYAQYEIDRRQADYETLKMIADYYGVTLDYLLGRVNNPNSTLGDQEKEYVTKLDWDDEYLIKEFPMTYKGRQLSEAEKRKVISVVRILLDQENEKGR